MWYCCVLQYVEGSFEKYLERLEDPKVCGQATELSPSLQEVFEVKCAVKCYISQETAGQVEINALSLLYRYAPIGELLDFNILFNTVMFQFMFLEKGTNVVTGPNMYHLVTDVDVFDIKMYLCGTNMHC